MASTDPNRPNILFILSDDQGPWAMNCAGTSELITPNLDRLADTGIRFENFFCASPVCSPARASILTGQMPSQHGVQDFLRAGNSAHSMPIHRSRDVMTNKEELTGLDGRAIEFLKERATYTEVLANNSYSCGLSGKWHIGDSATPQAGFSYWNVHSGGAGNYYNALMFRDDELYESDGYFSDVITDNAIHYLESEIASSNPFALNVHYTAPHAPWGREHHPPEYYEEYFDNCQFETVRWDPINPNQLYKQGSSGSVGVDEVSRHGLLSGYFAAITAMDTNIGRLIDWLEANNLRENTLIVFTSDNGMSMGHHGVWGKGNGTYPANMFDTAVKVPMLVSRPNHVPEGKVDTNLLSHYDLMPTLLEYVGLATASDSTLPGSSFASLLNGSKIETDRPVVVFDEYGPTRMIRTRTMKYIHRYPDGPNEFYDLSNDPLEIHNEIETPEFSETIASMRCALQSWFRRYAEPQHDGSKQPVTGRGQLDRIGGGLEAFAQDLVFLRDLDNEINDTRR